MIDQLEFLALLFMTVAVTDIDINILFVLRKAKVTESKAKLNSSA